ncbi:MAG TPA: DUF4124 domain-containing protein [Burkholderiales bacterium]|nr:DUF4124 domain-containing protein [Burkholderiales bacterium]
MNRAIIFGLGVLFAAAAAAQQYKWVDQNGKVQYGDVPPPGVKAQRLKPPPGAPAPAAAAKKDEKGAKALSPEAAYRKRQEDAQKENEKAAQAEQEAAAKRENCARAQESLRTLESGQRIARTDAKGERYYLEDAQIAQEITRARQMVRESCG